MLTRATTSEIQMIQRLIVTLCLNGISSKEAIIFWVINIESVREIQQVSAYNLTADVLLFKLSNVILFTGWFCNIDSVK